MAKKFVRGITDINEINKQDFDTNNVNDLLSDGEHNYIHRKKGKTEEYHNLTDNLKTVSSDNTDLLSITNDNETSNSATFHPKHDAQKEQAIASTRNTITIEHGENATTETTKVDTNPQKVLEHENLLTDYGVSKTISGNTLKLGFEYTRVPDGFDLNNLLNGTIRAGNLTNAPTANTLYYVHSFSGGGLIFQHAVTITDNNKYISFERHNKNNTWSSWSEELTDKSVIDNLLNQKQNTLSSNTSVGVTSNNQLKQLFYHKKTYLHTNGMLVTYIKSLAQNTNINVTQDEYHFTIKINKNVQSVVIDLTEIDTNFFNSIINRYGENNTVSISGCVFTLSGSTLTVSTANNTEQNYVITFSDII